MLNARNVCVRLATDDECDDLSLQDNVQAFMRVVKIPRRRALDWLYSSGKSSRAVLVDEGGNPVRLADLSDSDHLAFDLWLRDYILKRPPHIERRNRPESLERRRVLITLLRMAFPREATSWTRSLDELGIEFTDKKRLEMA